MPFYAQASHMIAALSQGKCSQKAGSQWVRLGCGARVAPSMLGLAASLHLAGSTRSVPLLSVQALQALPSVQVQARCQA